MGVPRGKAIGIRPAPNHGIGITVVGDMGNTNAFALLQYCVDFFGLFSGLVLTPSLLYDICRLHLITS